MARDFAGGRLVRSSEPLGGYPYTYSCLFNRDATPATDEYFYMFAISDADSNGLQALGIADDNAVGWVGYDGVDLGTCNSTATSSVDTWHQASISVDATNCSAFLDGANEGTASNHSVAWDAGIDTTVIGATNWLGLAGYQPMNGEIAEIGVWNVFLTDEEHDMLGHFISPRFVRPSALVGYCRVLGRASPEPDIIDGTTFSLTGTASVSSHPRLLVPPRARRRFIVPSVTDYTITADSGSFTWTGTAAGLEYHSALDAAAGSYAWTGTAASLEYGSVLSAEAGSYAWTGTAADLEFGAALAAEAGSYAWTGTAAGLIADTILTAEAGSYVWTGTDAGLFPGFNITADSASYAWTGQTATLIFDAMLSAEAGSYAWTGQDATLTYVQANTLVAGSGSYLWTGSNATLAHTIPGVAALSEPGFIVNTGRLMGR